MQHNGFRVGKKSFSTGAFFNNLKGRLCVFSGGFSNNHLKWFDLVLP